jgi:hypothetical protein
MRFLTKSMRLRTILAAGAVPFISLLEPFRAHVGEHLFGENDAHWTAHGQELAAEIVAEKLG